MKWPFVSRAAANERIAELRTLLDAVNATRNDERREAQARAEGAEVRYQALLDKYHALKVTGAVVVTEAQAAKIELQDRPPVDEMKELIGEVCGKNYAKRAIMLRQLALDRAAKVEESLIRAAILNGVPSDGVPT